MSGINNVGQAPSAEQLGQMKDMRNWMPPSDQQGIVTPNGGGFSDGGGAFNVGGGSNIMDMFKQFLDQVIGTLGALGSQMMSMMRSMMPFGG